jgi:four helix bundle protein
MTDDSNLDSLGQMEIMMFSHSAEGTSRFSNKDRKNFFVIARGSAFECVAILEYLNETEEITRQGFLESEQRLEEISKMLFGLIRGLDK